MSVRILPFVSIFVRIVRIEQRCLDQRIVIYDDIRSLRGVARM